ncbi:hypothetical protein MBLNU457_g2505t2 [Dothideomycetes sp. NU457]
MLPLKASKDIVPRHGAQNFFNVSWLAINCQQKLREPEDTKSDVALRYVSAKGQHAASDLLAHYTALVCVSAYPASRGAEGTSCLDATKYVGALAPSWLLTPSTLSPDRETQATPYDESQCLPEVQKQRQSARRSQVNSLDIVRRMPSENAASTGSARSGRSRIPQRSESKTSTTSTARPTLPRLPSYKGNLAYLDGCNEEPPLPRKRSSARSTLHDRNSSQDEWTEAPETLAPDDNHERADAVHATIVAADDITPLVPATSAKHGSPFSSNQAAVLLPLSPRRSQSCFAQIKSPSPKKKPALNRIQTPDRFIPARTLRSPSRDAFKMTYSPSKLSPAEKAERQQISNSDPFAPRARVSQQPSERLIRSRLPVPSRLPVYSPTRLRAQSNTSGATTDWHISIGGVWQVGGSGVVTDGMHSISNGRGGRIASGTNAPLHVADFFSPDDTGSDDRSMYQKRLAAAFDLDPANRMFGSPGSRSVGTPPSSSLSDSASPVRSRSGSVQSSVSWKDNAWTRDQPLSPKKVPAKRRKCVPIIPFRVLDAPAFRDDFYCSLLAYSRTAQCLAVGLGTHVYLWSESRGVDTPSSLSSTFAGHITSLSFSSTGGGNAILAIGRSDGRVTLWSPLDAEPRFDSEQPSSVSCLAFSPRTSSRYSVRHETVKVATELLVIGDEAGHIYIYAVEWPSSEDRDLYDWPGAMTLLARLTPHIQQVCGLAWSPDNAHFASGGNDNSVYIFETKKIISPRANKRHNNASDNSLVVRHADSYTPVPTPGQIANQQSPVPSLPASIAKHHLPHAAAVKALAFAPWQPTLLACGAGSNDRGIHFYHTLSGTKLAAIDCSAQREIAATFGFAQPEHPYRIAVYAWPSCDLLVRIPWFGEERALWAIAYPDGPEGEGKRAAREGGTWGGKRTREEGCLVVATSDASIKFHEVWSESGMRGGGRDVGVFGGSDVLEALVGVEKDGEVIR